ncbi:MAG: response regulator [Anaerolineales bacterium]
MESRVLLVDDHTLVRTGFEALLRNAPDVTVVGQACDGREALREIEQHQPDVVLLDIGLPNLNGIEVLARVSRDYPHIRVVILSMYANEEYVLQALQEGASGYVLKSADIDELLTAIHAVTQGHTYLSPTVTEHLAEYVRRTGIRNDSLARITARQRQVLRLLAEGHTSRQIARQLHISTKTVDSHRRDLMDRLDIHDLASLVRYAIRVGLVSPDE